jgi:hypothetical protein
MELMPDLPALPWNTFGPELRQIVQATVNKLDREWPPKWRSLGGAAAVLESFARIVHNSFHTIVVLSFDKPTYPLTPEDSLSLPPITRTLLDILFSTIFLLEDLPTRSGQYFKGGWRENAEEFQRILARYGQDPDWKEWIASFQGYLEESATLYGITADERANLKKLPYWPIPSRILKDPSLGADRRDLLQHLYDWYYKHLSAESHLSPSGLAMRVGALLPAQDDELRDWRLSKQRSDQVTAASLIALAFATEIDIAFVYGLRPRLAYVWTILAQHVGMARELYEPWYQTRM